MLDISVCFVLFAIFLEGLGGFFGNFYGEFIIFAKKVALNNEADAVVSFLRTYIREAEKIKITTEDGDIIEVILSGTHPEIVEKTLATIEVDGSKTIKLEAISTPTANQGKMVLKYTSGGTSKVISDKIENIKVTREKNSDIVEFTCTIHKAGEANDRTKVVIKFAESLAYKGKLGTSSPGPSPSPSPGT